MLNLTVIRLAFIHGSSMSPNLDHGSVAIVWQLFYYPQNGDIVVFDSKTVLGVSVVKRVIAVGGQTVLIKNNMVYLDDLLIDEPYLYEYNWSTPNLSVYVPSDYVFVMGDNRNQSKDSRDFGCLPVSSIIGKVLFK